MATGWHVAEVLADAASPGLGRGVHAARIAWTWAKIGHGVLAGRGAQIAASLHEQHGLSLGVGFRIGAPQGASPLGLAVGWDPVAQHHMGARAEVNIEEGVRTEAAQPQPYGEIGIRWLPPATAQVQPETGWPTGSRSSNTVAKVGLVKYLQPTGAGRLRVRGRLAVLGIASPLTEVATGSSGLDASTFTSHAERLGLIEEREADGCWYLSTSSNDSTEVWHDCRVGTLIYLDPEAGFSFLVELRRRKRPVITSIGMALSRSD